MNAKKELLSDLKDTLEIKCAEIMCNGRNVRLKIDYTYEDLEIFFKQLDFNYDSGYGGQELYGTVWLTDGSWMERGEYDGSEWWNHKVCSKIPKYLL